MNAELIATIESLDKGFAGRKVTMQDIERSHRDVAIDMACDFVEAYEGTFPFMLNMREWVKSGSTLTDQQIAGIFNAVLSDYRYAQSKAAVQQAEEIIADAQQPVARTYDHSHQVVTDGWYSIVGPKGGHRTLRLQTVQDDKSDGVKQWLAYLSGPDNVGDYLTIGFVHGNEVKLFRKNEGKYADIVAAARFLVKNADSIGEYGRQYALRSGKCYACNRKLTDPESIKLGIGPVCRAK